MAATEDTQVEKAMMNAKSAGNPGVMSMRLYIPWIATAERNRSAAANGCPGIMAAATPAREPQAPWRGAALSVRIIATRKSIAP